MEEEWRVGLKRGGDVNTETEELGQVVLKCIREIGSYKDQRTEANDGIKAIMQSLKRRGIPPEAVKRALKDVELEEDALHELDMSHALVRRLLNRPVQYDWIEEQKIKAVS